MARPSPERDPSTDSFYLDDRTATVIQDLAHCLNIGFGKAAVDGNTKFIEQ